MNKFKRYLVLSTFLHILPLLILVIFGGVRGTSNQEDKDNSIANEQQDNKKIIPKPNKKEEVEFELVEGYIPHDPANRVPHAKDDCKNFFGGIGITYSSAYNGTSNILIDRVYEGYPAYKAGIRANDIIMSPDIKDVEGDVGTEVTIIYRTPDSQVHTVTVVRDKICIEEINLKEN